jgi:hypothetical protein
MAALSKNGTELARLIRVKRVAENEPSLETTLSIRSNGWILKRTRWLGSSTGAWKQWQQWKAFGRETSTLPQVVRSLMERSDFALQSGSLAEVAAGWQRLCLKAKGYGLRDVERIVGENESLQDAPPLGCDGWGDFRRGA